MDEVKAVLSEMIEYYQQEVVPDDDVMQEWIIRLTNAVEL